MQEKIRIVFKIYGLVQGVGFRYFIKSQAKIFSIYGFARNQEDGSVFIDAEGKISDLEKFSGQCQKGPAISRVEKVEQEIKKNLINYQKFIIKF